MKQIKNIIILFLASIVLCQANGLLLFHHTCKSPIAACTTECKISLDKNCCKVDNRGEDDCCENEIAFFKSDSKFTNIEKKSTFLADFHFEILNFTALGHKFLLAFSKNISYKFCAFRHISMLNTYIPFLCQWRC